MTKRFQKIAFSVNSTRPHEADNVAFSNLSTLESVFKRLRFQWIQPVHTKPILLRFQIFPFWRAFSKDCVSSKTTHRFHRSFVRTSIMWKSSFFLSDLIASVVSKLGLYRFTKLTQHSHRTVVQCGTVVASHTWTWAGWSMLRFSPYRC